nr:pyridinium-3,5-biscarboxylic acid mononucleotide synthase-like [Nerophis lumbriciformis]
MHQHDDQRMERIGMPEAVLCSAKTDVQLLAICQELTDRPDPVLFTRLTKDRFHALPDSISTALDYDPVSQTAHANGSLPARLGHVAVVAAGTSDQRVAAEASRTLEFSGVSVETIVDVGVAGIWRLEARIEDIGAADIVIAVAGMDAAIVSVLGGLVGSPIIAVPTSVGYGVATGGTTALNSALASCAQGVAVMNIDNGFGAACAAIRMLGLLDTAT